jgi:hypothetical protein
MSSTCIVDEKILINNGAIQPFEDNQTISLSHVTVKPPLKKKLFLLIIYKLKINHYCLTKLLDFVFIQKYQTKNEFSNVTTFVKIKITSNRENNSIDGEVTQFKFVSSLQ